MDVRRPVGWVPVGDGDEVASGVGGWAGGWIEAGLVGLAGADGFCHRVVDFEDDAFSAVAVVLGFVRAADDGERVHDVVDGVARRRNPVAERRIVGSPSSVPR